MKAMLRQGRLTPIHGADSSTGAVSSTVTTGSSFFSSGSRLLGRSTLLAGAPGLLRTRGGHLLCGRSLFFPASFLPSAGTATASLAGSALTSTGRRLPFAGSALTSTGMAASFTGSASASPRGQQLPSQAQPSSPQGQQFPWKGSTFFSTGAAVFIRYRLGLEAPRGATFSSVAWEPLCSSGGSLCGGLLSGLLILGGSSGLFPSGRSCFFSVPAVLPLRAQPSSPAAGTAAFSDRTFTAAGVFSSWRCLRSCCLRHCFLVPYSIFLSIFIITGSGHKWGPKHSGVDLVH